MAIRVGRWDCPVCGTKGNLGPHTSCQNCGSARPENVRFYLPDEADIVRDEQQLKEAKSGVDWVCGHCSAHNKAQNVLCTSCGHPKDESSGDIDLSVREYETREIPRSGGDNEETSGEAYRREYAKSRTKPGYKRKKVGGVLGKILSVPILAAVLYSLLRMFPATIEVDVVGFRWERTIQFEHYEPVQEENWSTPSGAFDIQSFRAIHHYDKKYVRTETRTRKVQVKVGEERYVCGQRDLGNGYFEDKYCSRPIYEQREETYQHDVYEDIPVYRTKYRYKVMKWVRKKENLLITGAENQTPNWPEVPSMGRRDEWREGSKTEGYFVSVKEDDGDIHEEQIPMSVWNSLNVGQKLRAKRSRLLDIWYGLEMTKEG